MQVLKAGALYFAVVFGAGFVLGTIRTLWVVPRVGERKSELMEMPIMLVVTIVAAPSCRFWCNERAEAEMSLDAFKRWLYRGHRPNCIARILNKVWAAMFSTGVAPDYLATLEVTGRKSGRTNSLPVVVTILDGQRYLVSMLGNEAQWVQNVRAAAGRAVLRSGDREVVQLEEVPAEHRAPILKAYLHRAPGARPHVPVSKDAALAEFQRIAAEFPVFPITSAKTVRQM